VRSTDLLYALGDINQEYVTNEANAIWSDMRCDAFTNTDLANVNHFELPSHPAVLNATVAIISAATPGSLCSGASSLSCGWTQALVDLTSW
jgi:hypothetical protein